MDTTQEQDRFREAEEALADYLARVDAGERVSFEAWRAQRPRIASELDRLHAEFLELQAAIEARTRSHGHEQAQAEPEPLEPIRRLEPAGPLLERLRAAVGPRTDYVPGSRLGGGGMGEVFAVLDPILRRELAMKVIREDAAPGGDPSSRQRRLARFLEEAQVMAQLDHPGIVPVHELGVDAKGRPFLTMKRVRGRTLAEDFARVHARALSPVGPAKRLVLEPASLSRCLTHLLRVCEAMAYAHERGVIHRDLKPSNVMLGDHGEVYVMDWGLARVLGLPDVAAQGDESGSPLLTDRSESRGETPGTSDYTRTGQGLGTVQYMPPEQARGRWAEVDPRADVYAVGAMLYHLLAGRAPYAEPPGTAAEIQQRVIAGPPAALASLAPHAPAELVAICERAIERESTRRYQSMSALAADLRAFLDRRVVQAYATGPWAEARMWVRRNPAFATSAGLLVVLLLAAVLVGSKLAVHASNLDRSRAEIGAVLEANRAREMLRELRRLDQKFANALIQARDQDDSLLTSHGPVHGAQRAIVDALAEGGLPLDGSLPVDGYVDRWSRIASLEASNGAELARSLLGLRIWLEMTRVGHAARLSQGRYPAHLKRPETRALAENILAGDRTLVNAFLFLDVVLDRIELTQGGRRALDMARAFFERGQPLPAVDELWGQDDTFDSELLALMPLIGTGSSADERRRVFESLIRRDPSIAEFHYEVGTLDLGAGKLDAAIASLQTAIDLRPDWPAPRNQLSAALILLDGAAATYEAVHQAREAIHYDPTWVTAWVNLSAALVDASDFQGAVAAATRALELDPNRHWAFLNRALAREGLGDLEGAIEDCELALERRPEYARAAETLTRLQQALSERSE